jgi:hypothetical protein
MAPGQLIVNDSTEATGGSLTETRVCHGHRPPPTRQRRQQVRFQVCRMLSKKGVHARNVRPIDVVSHTNWTTGADPSPDGADSPRCEKPR